MLKNILNISFFTYMLFMLIFLNYFEEPDMEVWTFNFSVGIMYYLVLLFEYKRKTFPVSSLLIIIAIYSMIFIVTLNLISYNLRGNYLVFSESDAAFYDKMARIINYNGNFDYMVSNYNFDDWGAIVVVSIAYKLFGESNLSLNLLYWIMGIVGSYAFFKLCKNFMSQKMAYICTLAFYISSILLWYESSGLKEAILVFLVIGAFYNYYEFIKKRFIWNGLLLVMTLISILFFRPAISIFIGASFGITYILSTKSGFVRSLAIISIIILSFLFSFLFENLASRYLFVDKEISFIEVKEKSGLIKGGWFLTIITNIVSSLIGPIPNFNSNDYHQGIFASSLLLKNYLSFSFLVGSYYIIKNKFKPLYPILLFTLFEIISLTIILEALELRKSLPHFPMLYIIIFWFLDEFQNKNQWKKSVHQNINKYWKWYAVIFIILVLIWNFR